MLSPVIDIEDKMCSQGKKLDSFKLSFVVPGFSKCGTTSLCAMLARHPQISFSTPKEPTFFNQEDFEKHWSAYYTLFPAPHTDRLLGEGSTFYSAYQLERQSRDAILKHFPEIKLIFVARDPFQRIESGYREFHHNGALYGIHAPFGIRNALIALPALIEDSKYWTRINCYRERVPDERILVVFFEDLVRNPDQELTRCFKHLGIETNIAIDLPHLNAREIKYHDSRALRHFRNGGFIDRLISTISAEKQNRFFEKIKLRRKFSKPIVWDTEAIEYATKNLSQDIRQFLQFYGKPEDYWVRFANESNQNSN